MSLRTLNETLFASVTPTIQAALYATGDLVGGKMEISGLGQRELPHGVLYSVLVIDKDAQLGDFDLFLFDSDPSNTTFTENGAFSIAAGDVSKLLAVINFTSADDTTVLGTRQFFFKEVSVPYRMVSTSGFTTDASVKLYAALVARSGPTFTTTSSLILKFGAGLD